MAALVDQIPNIGAKNTQDTLMHIAIKLTISATGNHVGSSFSDAADSRFIRQPKEVACSASSMLAASHS
jgi:hypothetical protein